MAREPQAPVKGRCPNCGKPTSAEFRPFCSRRCADLDLHRWLSGGYAIPVQESDDRPQDAAAGEGDEGKLH
jgi:endogenous inhibitor of DNA gyrase (YacG/DUF329 family)